MRRRTYNPAQLTAEELKASFTARGGCLAEMLRILRAQAPGRPCQHLLLVGARGMGKTTLGLRFLQAVREAEDLATAWQPVPLDEESYEVTDLAGLWLLALQHLSRATGQDRWQARAGELLHGESDASRREAYALASLLDFCATSGRRIILFVENLDQIFTQISDERELHALRSALIEHPELLLVGSACGSFDGIRNHSEPFYEFFQRIDLPGLGSKACHDVFQGAFKREGKPMPAGVASTEQARIETIHTLTGGNPRLLVLAADILMESPLGSAFEDLERLIDEQTPYFKALIEALPVQARKVFHYLAGEWAPLRARDIAAGVDLTASHISAQLRQLTNKGYVRELRLTGETRARYEVADRFYNIYYLLRFNKPGRKRLERFVTFLHDLYGDVGMHSLYDNVLRSLRERPMPTNELADWIRVFSEHVATDQQFAGRDLWLAGAVKASIEILGDNSPVLDELDDKAPFAAVSAYVEKAQEYVLGRRYTEAGTMFDRAARRAPKDQHGMAQFLSGLAQLLANQPDEALSLLEEAVELLPDGAALFAGKSLMLIAGLRLELGAVDEAAKAVHQAWHSVQPAYREVLRHGVQSLHILGELLWHTEQQELAISAWLMVSNIVTETDGPGLRSDVARSVYRAGRTLSDIGKHERACEALQRLESVVNPADDAGLRLLRLGGLAAEGLCHWSSERLTDALTVWQRAPDFVQPGDEGDTRQLAAYCLAMASLLYCNAREPDGDWLREADELARRAVSLAPDSAPALHALGHTRALAGDWGHAITALGRAVSCIGDAEGAAVMLPTLMHIAAAGHAAEIRDLMANTRLQVDLEALWSALELELGHPIEALPSEIKEAVDHIRQRLAQGRKVAGPPSTPASR